MIALSDSARRSLDHYLRQARAYLRGSRSVDAEEVEQNITEHIENALAGTDEPVSRDKLDAVLRELGDPHQWVPEEELPWWRQFVLRLRSGPEDWRLAYISFALFVAALTVAPTTPVFVALLFAGFLASRAAISYTADPAQLRAQKWLLYPSLITVYGFVLGVLLTWPVVLAVAIGEEYEGQVSQLDSEFDYWFSAFSAGFAAMGAWWAILALVTLIFGTKAAPLLRPFADGYKTKWAFILLIIGSVVTIVSAGVGFAHYTYFTGT